jgi:hypothetical protein
MFVGAGFLPRAEMTQTRHFTSYSSRRRRDTEKRKRRAEKEIFGRGRLRAQTKSFANLLAEFPELGQLRTVSEVLREAEAQLDARTAVALKVNC